MGRQLPCSETYYAEQCRDIDIIHLNGSIEIAPILNLSDVIVDMCDTPRETMKAVLKAIYAKN